MFSNPTVTSTSTLKEFIESFSPLSSEQTDFEFDLDPFLSATSDAWKIFLIIENNNELMSILVQGPSRKILVDLT